MDAIELAAALVLVRPCEEADIEPLVDVTLRATSQSPSPNLPEQLVVVVERLCGGAVPHVPPLIVFWNSFSLSSLSSLLSKYSSRRVEDGESPLF